MARTSAAHGDNRAKLIAAAYQILAEEGYEASTIKAVARKAGVAPGLIHYYFASKEELLSAVLEDAATRYAEEMRHLGDHAGAPDVIAAALHARQVRVEHDPDRERLRFELFALGLRHAGFRPAVARVLAIGRAGIGDVLHASGHPTDPALAAIFLAALDGLALQYLVDPTFDLAGAYRALERLAHLAIQQRE